MCEYFCIGLIDFISKIESMLDRTNLFSDNDYEKMMKQLKKLFLWIDLKILGWEKSIVLSVKSIGNLKSLKYHIFAKKHYLFLII